MAKGTKTIWRLSRDNEGFGYAFEIDFVTYRHDGKIEFYIKKKERWEDGHITFPPRYYTDLGTNKELGNAYYKQYLVEGFKLIDKYTIEA